MEQSATAGIGRLAIRRRAHMALVQPRDGGIVLFTLRSAQEVLAAEFPGENHDLDSDMIAIAKTIIERRTGSFDPSTFRDPRAEALRQLAEAKLKGETIKLPPAPVTSPVANLMDVLKRSLAEESGKPASASRRKAVGDGRQRSFLLPVSGKGERRRQSGTSSAEKRPRRRSGR